MNLNTVIDRNPAILFSQLDEEYLALDAEAGFCYSLNLVSGHIWHLLEQPTTVRALCTQLQRQYMVDDATCQQDVSDVLLQLADAGLVTIHVPHGGA